MPDFEKTLDAADPNQVTPTSVKQDGETLTTGPLEVEVKGPDDANRLLIFTGIAITRADFEEDDEILRRGLIRIKLNYPLPGTVKFISSSTTAALGNIFNNTGEAFTFAVVDAATEPQLIDPLNPKSGHELVLTSNVAVQGHATGISAMSYQANVLVRDTNPELESILVRNVVSDAPSGGLPFSPSTTVNVGDAWEYQITLTGPVARDTELILVSSSNPSPVPVGALEQGRLAAVEIEKDHVSVVVRSPRTTGEGGANATITASFTRRDGRVVQKIASVGTLSFR